MHALLRGHQFERSGCKGLVGLAQGEVKLLLELLPRYTAHVLKHPHTLLIKFFGLYRVTPANGAKACLLDACMFSVYAAHHTCML